MTSTILVSLARDAVAEAAQLREVLRAYVGLENLMAPPEAEERPCSDVTEIRALLRMVNGGLQRQIEMLERSVGTVLDEVACRERAATGPA